MCVYARTHFHDSRLMKLTSPDDTFALLWRRVIEARTAVLGEEAMLIFISWTRIYRLRQNMSACIIGTSSEDEIIASSFIIRGEVLSDAASLHETAAGEAQFSQGRIVAAHIRTFYEKNISTGKEINFIFRGFIAGCKNIQARNRNRNWLCDKWVVYKNVW